MTITEQQKKDIAIILKKYGKNGAANDILTIEKALKGQPRLVQLAMERFMRQTFVLGEVVSKAMHMNDIVNNIRKGSH